MRKSSLILLPILVGLGINYGIHVLHRYHEEGMPATNAARRLAASVGSAAATTVVGFAGLLLARHPGLWSMGFTASLGIGIVCLSCLLFLPALTDLLELFRRSTGATSWRTLSRVPCQYSCRHK